MKGFAGLCHVERIYSVKLAKSCHPNEKKVDCLSKFYNCNEKLNIDIKDYLSYSHLQGCTYRFFTENKKYFSLINTEIRELISSLQLYKCCDAMVI